MALNLSGWTAQSITGGPAIPGINSPKPGSFAWQTFSPSAWVSPNGPDIFGSAVSKGPAYSYTPGPEQTGPLAAPNANSADVVHNILSAIYGPTYQSLLNYDPYKAIAKPTEKKKKKSGGLLKLFSIGPF